MAYAVAPVAPVAVGDPTAVFGRRVVAAAIDLTIAIGPAVYLVANDLTIKTRDEYETDWAPHNGNIPIEGYCTQYLEQAPNAVCGQSGDVLVVGPEQGGGPQLMAFALLLVLGVLLQGLTGWTVGKLVLGLRTVRADGRACGIPRAALRWVLWLIDGLPYVFPLVGFITALTTQGHRRVGDMAAKTFVVRKDAMGSPIVVPGMTAPPPPGQYAPPPAGAPTWVPPTAPPDPTTAGWAAPPAAGTPPPAETTGTWSPPPPPQWGQPTPPPASPPPPGVEAPHWDEARNAYIQWDPDAQAWMQWDEPGQRWFKIGGQ